MFDTIKILQDIPPVDYILQNYILPFSKLTSSMPGECMTNIKAHEGFKKSTEGVLLYSIILTGLYYAVLR